MPMPNIPVVGRPFTTFAEQVGGLTPDRALTRLREGSILGPARLTPGQGVTAEEWTAIEAAAAGVERVTADPYPRRTPVRAGLHKGDPRNVLIADLERTANDRWRATLVIHPESAPLADRDNGNAHVPGMVEIEACLQITMAATERDLLPGPGTYDFISSRLELDFAAFMFPLPAVLELRADRIEQRRPSLLALDATAEIHQGGRRLMTARFHSTAFEHGYLDPLERARALAALAATTEPTLTEH